MKRALIAALLVAAACNNEKKEAGFEDLDFGHGAETTRQAEAAKPTEAPKVVEAPKPAPEAPFVVPKFVISTDAAIIAQGKDLFSSKGCVGCHKIGGGKLVGPDLKGVTARREQDWVSKMILRPDLMVKEDETAKKLLAEHMVPMPNQNVDAAKELPLLVAFLKSNEQ